MIVVFVPVPTLVIVPTLLMLAPETEKVPVLFVLFSVKLPVPPMLPVKLEPLLLPTVPKVRVAPVAPPRVIAFAIPILLMRRLAAAVPVLFPRVMALVPVAVASDTKTVPLLMDRLEVKPTSSAVRFSCEVALF